MTTPVQVFYSPCKVILGMNAAELAADEIERLNAVGPFVNLGDPRITHILFDAVLADIAVPAVNLHGQVGNYAAHIGEVSFQNRGQQRHQIIGAFAFMPFLGFSVNLLTLFGLILAIGIVVDDAIVVLENVERLMKERRLPPRSELPR